ncbi:Lar family restriction alleviation protein [Noviherbaspirillum sp.]|uniref:Lar family restriction alleviation protein n=1 Tax=Noviherbaspirillum sp. TaxID=1926288 RepID=UPI0039C8E237
MKKYTTVSVSTTELLPCPFCGSRATLSSLPMSPSWWRVRCDSYHCGGSTWAMGEAEEAVNAWNRRANEQG